jgi:hypothetical protein
MPRSFLNCMVAVIVMFSSVARADNFSVNLGAGEFAGLTPLSHGGIYLFAGPSYTHELSHDYTWTTAITLEYAPEFSHLGLFVWSTLDVPLSSSWYMNVGLNGIQDQFKGEIQRSTFYFGPLIGVTRNFIHGFFVSPSVGVYYGFEDHGLWAYPMLTFGKSL